MKKKTIKFKCSGCGVKFDLNYERYVQQSKWGKKNFYHTAQCAVNNHKALVY